MRCDAATHSALPENSKTPCRKRVFELLIRDRTRRPLLHISFVAEASSCLLILPDQIHLNAHILHLTITPLLPITACEAIDVFLC